MIQVKRKERETAESLIRRFSRRVQQSGVLKQVRKLRFRAEEPSRDKRRIGALYKVKIRKEITYVSHPSNRRRPEVGDEVRRRLSS